MNKKFHNKLQNKALILKKNKLFKLINILPNNIKIKTIYYY